MGRSALVSISIALVVAASTVFGGLAGVGAAEPPAATSRTDLIADTLLALGVDPGVVDEIILAVGATASNELGRMLDDGLVSEAQLDTLAAEVDGGTLPESVSQIVQETRIRRDAYRAAAVDALENLGVEAPPGVPVGQILADNGIDPDEFVSALPDDLPPPPGRGEASPVPPTTVPPTTVPPTTVPASPDQTPTYPSTQPDQYPVTPSPSAPVAPQPEYPVTGGSADEGSV